MENNLEHKYKDRAPLNTVSIIKRFFEENGFDTHELVSRNPSGTWSSVCEISMKGFPIVHTNGKAMKKDFALASGWGEMYERFCGFYQHYGDEFLLRKCKEKNGPIIRKNEKYCTFEDNLISEYFNEQFFSNFSLNEKKKIYNEIFGEKSVGVVYKNVLTNEEHIFNHQALTMLVGSNGYSAGNSFEEAFNQGFSELVERHAFGQYLENNWQSFYRIKNDSIKNEEIKEIIKKLEEEQKDVYIFDCSYNTKCPVMLSIIVDKVMKRFNINFGCFPVFDIALERILTETNQNLLFSTDMKQKDIEKPYKDLEENNKIRYMKNEMSSTAMLFFQNDESFVTKIVEVEKESEWYLKDKNSTNIEIFNYWKKFIQERKLNVWYADFSLLNNMFAVKTFADGFGETFNKRDWIFKEKPKEEIKELFNDLFDNLYNEEENFNEFKFLFKKIANYEFVDSENVRNTYFAGESLLGWYKRCISALEASNGLKQLIDEVELDNFKEFEDFKDELTKFSFLINNISNIKNSHQNYYYKFNKNDIVMYKNFDYLLKEIIYKPLRGYIHSGVVDKISEIFIGK